MEKRQIALHFTNGTVSWGGKSPFKSTGFVESICQEGARSFLNVGMGDPWEVAKDFVHHGVRTNKKRVSGVVSVPVVIVLDVTGLAMQQGYDGERHRQINERVEADRVLGVFTWDPIGIKDLTHKGRKYQAEDLVAKEFEQQFRQEVEEASV
jgi:hypothetical protein